MAQDGAVGSYGCHGSSTTGIDAVGLLVNSLRSPAALETLLLSQPVANWPLDLSMTIAAKQLHRTMAVRLPFHDLETCG